MNEILTDDEPLFPEAEIKFATFWPRLGALLLDTIIIGIITLPITYLNLSSWKIPGIYILTTLVSVFYKPIMEYKYGATFGKMAAGLEVVGYNFGKLNLSEELKRVSFYYLPSILIAIMTARNYFSPEFVSISGIRAFQSYVSSSNPAIPWVNGLVSVFAIADCISFFSNDQRRSLHDTYAGTYVIQKRW
jgi:uncharacterized RDD family membrane protein YckC